MVPVRVDSPLENCSHQAMSCETLRGALCLTALGRMVGFLCHSDVRVNVLGHRPASENILHEIRCLTADEMVACVLSLHGHAH